MWVERHKCVKRDVVSDLMMLMLMLDIYVCMMMMMMFMTIFAGD